MIDDERPGRHGQNPSLRAPPPKGRHRAPGLVSMIFSGRQGAAPLRATCHVPEVFLVFPFARRAPRPANASSSRRPSGGGRPGSSSAVSRGPGALRTGSRPVMPAEVLWTVPETGMPTFAELGLPEPVLPRARPPAASRCRSRSRRPPCPRPSPGVTCSAAAQTGSGKTLAFGLAAARPPRRRARPSRGARGLVLVPTRELAQQVVDAVAPYAKALRPDGSPRSSAGCPFNRQAGELHARRRRRDRDARAGSPTTSNQRQLSPRRRRGHRDRRGRPDGRHGVPAAGPRDARPCTPTDGQRLLFSATLDGEVATLVRRYLHDPVTHRSPRRPSQVETMEHHLLVVDDATSRGSSPRSRPATAGRSCSCDTKHGVDRLVKILRRDGIAAGALHGGQAQNARNRAISDFKDGSTAGRWSPRTSPPAASTSTT